MLPSHTVDWTIARREAVCQEAKIIGCFASVNATKKLAAPHPDPPQNYDAKRLAQADEAILDHSLLWRVMSG